MMSASPMGPKDPTTPLSEPEKRTLLLEAIRLSPIPLDKLLDLLREADITPQWEDMVLPNGRTMATCKRAFEALFQSGQTRTFQPVAQSLPLPPNPNKRKSAPEIWTQQTHIEPPPKRRQSGVEIISGAREIAPKPTNGSPGPMGAPPGKTPKKRGRPSKADQERKQAEAIARGDIIAPTMTMSMGSLQIPAEEPIGYAPIAPNPPPTAPTTIPPYDAPSKEGAEYGMQQKPGGDAQSKKRRKPQPKAPVPTTMGQGQSSFSVHPPIEPRELKETREPEQPPILPRIEHVQSTPSAMSVERLTSSTPYDAARESQAPVEPRPPI